MAYKIYIAGSFSCEREKNDLNKLIKKVRKIHTDAELFIPMEHFVPGGNEQDPPGNYLMPNQEWGRKVYEMDKAALDECDELIAIYRGRISSSGTVWEIGYICGQNQMIDKYNLSIPKKKTTIYIPDEVDICSCMVINGVDIVISNKINEQK